MRHCERAPIDWDAQSYGTRSPDKSVPFPRYIPDESGQAGQARIPMESGDAKPCAYYY